MADTALNAKVLNHWGLFWLVSLPMSAVMLIARYQTDLDGAEGVSQMIGFSVRAAVPFIFIVVAIAPLHTLFTNSLTSWLLRNRKYIGFCFAVAMAWQGLFIYLMSTVHREFYFDEIFYLRDELEGSTGYIFLALMVATSFRAGRRLLSPGQWRLLHLSAIYFLWAYPFSVYWWNLSFYDNPQFIDYVFYWMGFCAFALRIAAWGTKRFQAGTASMVQLATGTLVTAIALGLAATGRQWQEATSGLLTTPEWSANLELWLPFWPFEPFLPLAVLGMGVAILTHSRRQLHPNTGIS